MHRHRASAVVAPMVLAVVLLSVPGCGNDEDHVTRTTDTGTVEVTVKDNSGDVYLEGVEITLSPPGLTGSTDPNGKTAFQVAPGGYFVDAQLCCVGPGLIQYHEPVTVAANETTSVTLTACLSCE